MKTITALKFEDENGIDFATTDLQKREFREIVNEMNHQTGEDWSSCLSVVEVDEDEDGNITYNGSMFLANSDKGNGFYSMLR